MYVAHLTNTPADRVWMWTFGAICRAAKRAHIVLPFLNPFAGSAGSDNGAIEATDESMTAIASQLGLPVRRADT